MGLPWFVTQWLRTFAGQRVRAAVVQAAQERLDQAARGAEEESAEDSRRCDVAVVFALGSESGCFEDLLEDTATIRGEGFKVRRGGVKGRHMAVVLSGAGRKAAAHATDAALTGHRPAVVISAGFCGGLDPAIRRHDLVVADAIVGPGGGVLELEKVFDPAAVATKRRVHVGRIVTVDQIVHLPSEKRALGEEHQALAVDMESLAVAEACRQANVPCAVVRVVSDAVDDRLPKEVSHLVRQKSAAGQLGAALGSILNRPGSVKDMVRLKENALVASDLLAGYLAAVVEHLFPLPPAPR